ncbi:hypothetical protein [Kitasatospora paranensis]|uniref:Secreted protein n=1 Tax=Kitasatospora paranensis TaxID=258053 RepID=A0ABW2G487_9ACTN
MTAPAPVTAEPERPVRVGGHPAVVLSVLLVAGLLALLPCAGNAKAVGLAARASHAHAAAKAGAVPAASAAASTSASAPDPAAARQNGIAAMSRAPHSDGHQAALWADFPGRSDIWCTADGGVPGPGKGCTSHPFCGPGAQLPNAPPQPGAVALPLLVAAHEVPAAVPVDTPFVSGPAPDLHVLQVHRS